MIVPGPVRCEHRSPGRIGMGSPSTLVYPPSLEMMNRSAASECRCARATSPGDDNLDSGEERVGGGRPLR